MLFLGALAYWVYRDQADYAAFKALEDTRARQAFYRKWVVLSALLFGGGTVVSMASLGRLAQLWTLPPEVAGLADDEFFEPVREVLAHTEFLMGLGAAMLAGTLIPTVIHALQQGRGSATVPVAPGVAGDIQALLPRNGAERWWAGLLSLNAGLTEELAFRLFLPLLITLVTGDAKIGFILAGVVFGVMHLYQGWIGVLGTMVTGALLSILYLASGGLLVPILLHIAIDLYALLLRPMIAAWLTR
ncbi:CPBP family intramembrane glutamic endopeptidase [Nitrospirillum pindoramense]|uniref:CPBP family intramembrane glutamic endopeptidase n=1 Tax=Nitrospirillum amazonense TaxID=28077 RepID=UPI001644D6A4|nr:CPBP family intramembrane glutamic endopeptidase [Nitrospirillum amazonense]